MISSLSVTTLITLLPLVVVTLAIFILYRRRHGDVKTKRYMYFVLGFVLLTAFYIVAPDPEVVQSLYVSQGNYTTPVFWSLIAAVLLFFCIYVFKKHEET